MMPNVIPARVANYHDLHGMNMTVDAGHASTLAAFEAAERFLCSGELDMAIVGGINGNVAEEVSPAFGLPLAEGIVLFAVTTARRARAEGLPVLAVVGGGDARAAVEPAAPCDATGRAVTYAGADSAIDVLRALVVRTTDTTLARDSGGDRLRYALHVACEPAAAQAAPPHEPREPQSAAPPVQPVQAAPTAVAAPGTLLPGALRRGGRRGARRHSSRRAA
jgi:hypothetical protein